MNVTAGALLGVRRLLGWHNLEMTLPTGATVTDWLKAIKVPGGGNVFNLMIMENGKINPKYMIMYDRVRIGDEMLDMTVKDGDRLVLLDYMYLPKMFVA